MRRRDGGWRQMKKDLMAGTARSMGVPDAVDKVFVRLRHTPALTDTEGLPQGKASHHFP
ncbi:MAG: hypothetical protein M0R28_00675 [Pigmentiphaga sp.]|nr:hypothetical protein [Pigmentiphaga sp.]